MLIELQAHRDAFIQNTATDHKEGEQLEDRRSVGASSCNCGDGTDQRVQSSMFMMMMVVVVMILLVELHAKLVHGMKISQYTKRFASYKNNKCIKININKYNKTRGVKQISPITQKKTTKSTQKTNKQTKRDRTTVELVLQRNL